MAEFINQAENLIYTTERAIEEYSELLSPQEIAEIKVDLDYCKMKMNGKNLQTIKEAVLRLETSAHLFSEVIYKDFMDDKNK
jgi:molecular chaperone DnaK